MDVSFTRDAINAILALFEKYNLSHEVGAEELRKLQSFNLDLPNAAFGARWRLANSAAFLATRTPDPVRLALLSTAYLGYHHCVATDSRFRQSYEATRAALPPTGPLPELDILDIFAQALAPAVSIDVPPVAPTPRDDRDVVVHFDSSDTYSSPDMPTAPIVEVQPRQRPVFASPATTSLRERFESLLSSFPTAPLGVDTRPQKAAHDNFRGELANIMKVGDAGRTFTEFAPLDTDLAELEPRLLRLAQTDNPRMLQERARTSRRLAEALDFTSASPDDYRCGRSAWLVSAFWNSQLSRHWPASRPNVVYDFLGYLTTIQAELRYSDAEFLLLLRVSFSICRIASHDGLMPYQFSTAADRLGEWVQYTAGTILASAGPGRVPPSRVPYDPRLGVDRRDYAAKLLHIWRSDSERAAASTILLEMGAWDPVRSNRLLAQVLSGEAPEFEVWRDLINTMAAHSTRVRVVRPNPWAPGTKKAITVEREAVAILAADVVDRHYQVLGGDISLKGHDFRERRVPTFVCSAEFGPLGLFKLDTADRIVREVDNFAKYAQRLHPRYRASRCDQSKAVITEPDDAKQFVQGALTSYVFTEDETPRTLNAWFMTAPSERASALCAELFERALRPWYGHATSTTIDVFSEFPIFDQPAIERLVRDCREFHSIDVMSDAAGAVASGAVRWILSLLKCLQGHSDVDESVAYMASELQVLRSYRSVCHGDLHLDNVLVVGKPGAEYPCVIDFEATHEGYVLKDFGRFVGAAVCRTFSWSADEREELLKVLPRLLLVWGEQPQMDIWKPNVRRVGCAILAARNGILRAWQAGSYPRKVELAAALVASFLPFARYPDTQKTSASLCLELTSRFVTALDGEP